MKIRLALAVVLSFVATSVNAQQSYNPGRVAVPAAQAQAQQAPASVAKANAHQTAPEAQAPAPTPKVDRAAEALKERADWHQRRKACYNALGLREGVHYRVNPANELNYQVRKEAHLQFNSAGIDRCDAI